MTSFRQDYGLIIVGAIIFTASFMWKDLLTDIQEIYFPKANHMLGRIIFTLIVTSILVIMAAKIKDKLSLSSKQNLSEAIIHFDDSPIDNNND